MRHKCRALSIICISIASLMVSLPAPAQTDAEEEVRQVVMDLAAAYGANDVEAYFSYFADDLTQWWPGRRVSREEYHTMWTQVVADGGGYTSVEVTDLTVQVSPSGDAAVASYLLKYTRRTPDRSSGAFQLSPTFFKRGGEWKIVHLHYSAPPS